MKLQKYSITGRLWRWVGDFLRGRQQQVSLRGCLSEVAAVLSEIPQGSLLGPLLSGKVNSGIQKFADDSELYNDVTLLQNDLDRLQEWAKAWELNFNPEKC